MEAEEVKTYHDGISKSISDCLEVIQGEVYSFGTRYIYIIYICFNTSKISDLFS